MKLWARFRLSLAGLKSLFPKMEMPICLRCGEILDDDGRCPVCREYGGPGP